MSRIIKLAEDAKEFVTGEDGFVVYWPSKPQSGAYSAADLRALADELDKKTKIGKINLHSIFQLKGQLSND
jgi:hypothetical protein